MSIPKVALEVVKTVREAGEPLTPNEVYQRLCEVFSEAEVHKGVRSATQRGLLWFNPEMKLDLDVGYFASLGSSYRPHKALDAIYDIVDGMLLKGRFGDLDLLLERMSMEHQARTMTVDVLLAFLTLTKPAEHELTKRDEFVKRAAVVIKERGPDEFEDNMEGLW